MNLLKCLFVLFLCSPPLYATSPRQENLKKRGALFNGWQDEGLLKVKENIIRFRRLSLNELNHMVEQQIAADQECQARNIAGNLPDEDPCKNGD